MSTILNVYLKSEKVGNLQLDDSRRFIFTYDKDWLQLKTVVPLSISLPLQQEPFQDDHARPFFF